MHRSPMNNRFTQSLSKTLHRPFWIDNQGPKEYSSPRLTTSIRVDLAIIGGGFSGLWSAILAKEANPAIRVAVLEAQSIGSGASGRNGGFVQHSLTHGLEQGQSQFNDELYDLEKLGVENFLAIGKFIENNSIECDYQVVGSLEFATRKDQDLKETVDLRNRYGQNAKLLSAKDAKSMINVTGYQEAIFNPKLTAIVDPYRLSIGLYNHAIELGIEFFENTPVTSLRARGSGLHLQSDFGEVISSKAILATNVATSLNPQIRRYILPVYDYVLMTEPLERAQLEEIKWEGRWGLSDIANQFHYCRLTSDNRILWGGYDAIYHYGGRLDAGYEWRPKTYEKLANQFFVTFPNLEGIGFSHAWSGAIDTCTRFSPFFGTIFDKKVAYSTGYTGLGVAATRFGAQVTNDLLFNPNSKLLCLKYTKSKPRILPPEPFRYAAVQVTRHALAREDLTAKEGLWLRTTRALGYGFDS